MSSMNVNIGTIGKVTNFNISNSDDSSQGKGGSAGNSGGQSERTQNGQSGGEQHQQGLAETAGSSGRLNLSLPSEDGNSVHPNAETSRPVQDGQSDVRFPIQAEDSGETSAGPATAAPIPVEGSTDYISAGRAGGVRPGASQAEAAHEDPHVALDELKAFEGPGQGNRSPSEEPDNATGRERSRALLNSEEQTSPKDNAWHRDVSPRGVSSEPSSLQEDGGQQGLPRASSEPAAVGDCGGGGGNRDAYSSLAVDSGPLSVQNHMSELSVGRPNSSDRPSTSLGTVDLGGTHPSMSTGNQSTASPGPAFSSLPDLSSRNLMSDGDRDVEGNSTSQHEGQSSRSQQSESEDILVVVRGNQVLQNEGDPNVVVTNLHVAEDVLRTSQQTGFFPEGTTELQRVTWLGFRQFEQTRWHLKLIAGIEPSQQKELIRQVSATLLEPASKIVRRIMRQLKSSRPPVYLKRTIWNDGLILQLGHANPEQCEEYVGEARQQEIEDIIRQLLPESSTSAFVLSCAEVMPESSEPDTIQRPTSFEESAELDINLPPTALAVGGRFLSSSVESGDMYGSFATTGSSTPTENGTTFREAPALSTPSSESQLYTPPSPSVDIIETSSQSSIQVISPQNGYENTRNLHSLVLSQSRERYQTLSDQLAMQQETHQREMEELKRSLEEMQRTLEERDRRESSSQASLQNVLSAVKQQEEALKKMREEVMTQVSDMSAKLKEQKKLIDDMQDNWLSQQEVTFTLQRDLQAREALFHDAEENMKRWCTNFETRGRHTLERALQQVQELDLQRREMAAQRDNHFEAVIKKFQTDLITRVMSREQRVDRYLQDLHTHMMNQEMRDETKYQACLLEINQLRRNLEGSKRGGATSGLSGTGATGSRSTEAGSPDTGALAPVSKDLASGQEEGATGGEPAYTVGVVTSEIPRLEDFMGKSDTFAGVLSETEALTTKMKGSKEEEMSSNLDERLRMPLPLHSFAGTSSSTKGKYEGDASFLSPFSLVKPKSKKASGQKSSSSTGKTSQKTPAKPPEKTSDAQQKDAASSKRPEPAAPGGPAASTDSPKSNSANEEGTPEKEMSPDAGAKNGKGTSEETRDMSRAEQFLDSMSLNSSLRESDRRQRMTKSIDEALRDEEVPAPRAKCLDTLLCLDVSESIVKDGQLEKVRETALKFVDGIEDLMDAMDLEENIALIAMGGRARVLQHLTNDLSLVRKAIESLHEYSGGRSPYLETLSVCLAANKGRGGTVNVSGCYKVRPRIIFITDGRPTDESVDTGPDHQSNINQVKFSMVQLLSELSAKKHKSTPKPIIWVPIGTSPDRKFMESLASLSGGQVVPDTEITSLCRYYKVQRTIGHVYKMVKNHKDEYNTEERIGGLVKAIAGNTTAEERKEIIGEVMRLQKEPPEEEEPDADDFSHVYEDEEKVKNKVLLPLGTRVRRGPGWRWKNQDTDGPGTVIQHSKNDNWIYVKWDNGTYNAYRYNDDGVFDVKETNHDPRELPPDKNALDFGVRVVRGPDWKFDNQDGGGPGTVIRVRESDGKVKVRWDATGKIHKYDYSAEKGREVQAVLPEFPKTEQQKADEKKKTKDASGPEKVYPMWKWRDSKNRWRLYPEEIAVKLEAEYQKRPQGSYVINREGTSRRVSFKLWREKVVDGGYACDVDREMVDEETKNDLLAVELSLQIN